MAVGGYDATVLLDSQRLRRFAASSSVFGGVVSERNILCNMHVSNEKCVKMQSLGIMVQ